MLVTPEFRRQRHEENKFEASLGYISGTLAKQGGGGTIRNSRSSLANTMSSRPAGATGDLVSKITSTIQQRQSHLCSICEPCDHSGKLLPFSEMLQPTSEYRTAISEFRRTVA